MIVRYHGKSSPLALIDGKDYEVLSIECGLYRVIDEEGIDPYEEVPGYLYPPESFEIVSSSPNEYEDKFAEEETSSEE